VGVDVELLEFDPDAPSEVLAAMAELSAVPAGGGWLTLDPAIDERFPPPEQSTFGRLVSSRGPAVPRVTWVPADTARRSPEPVSESLRQRCIPSPLGAATARTESAQYYNELDGLIVEYAMQFPSTAAAERFTGELAAAFATCGKGDPAEATVVDTGPEPVASGFRAARATTPTADAGLSYYELGVNAKANIVVVLEWTSMGNPYGRDATTWVWTADRLRLALDRAVSAAPAT